MRSLNPYCPEVIRLNAPEIALIGLDVDGTLVEPDPGRLPVRVVPAARDAIWRAYERGCRFAIVTGRNLAEIEALFGDGTMPKAPFVAFVSDERDVWWLDGGLPALDESWSRPLRDAERCHMDKCTDLLRAATAALDPACYELVNLGDYHNRCYVGASLHADEDVRAVLEHLQSDIDRRGLPLITLRNGRWVAVRHRDTGKGAALAYVAGKLGIPNHHVLATGDSANDASMLSGQGFVPATTSNADDEIKALVQQRGGLIATRPRGEGVAEIIDRCVILSPEQIGLTSR